MRLLKVIFAVILFFLSIVSLSRADFRATPAFSIREEYNDNIYLDHADKESDFITTVRPSVNLSWDTRFVDLSLNLGLEYEKYLDHSEEDDLRPSQGARLDSTWNLYRDAFFLRVTDSYERVAIDEGGKGGVDNNLVNLTDSNRLVVNPYLLLPLMRTLQMRLDYQYENIWYREDEGNDAENHRYSVTLTQELTARISADLYGGFTQYRPKDATSSLLDETGEEEYDRRDLRLGLLWNVSDQLSLYGTVGRSWLDYAYRKDYDTTLVSGQADYQLSTSLTVGAGYSEEISDSVEEGARKQKKYSTYLRYSDGFQVSLTLFKTKEDYLEISRQDDSQGGTLSGEIPVTEKEGVTWLFNYTEYKEDYNEDSSVSYTRYDDDPLGDQKRYGARIGLYHQLRLGRVSAGYTWNRNDAEISENDYTNNIIFVQLALSL